jgi:hypothetical protein
MSLKDLLTLPPGVADAAAVVAAVDRCFLVGIGRLGPDQQGALQALGRVFAGTPLAAAVNASVAAVSRNEFVERHFAVLAAGRAALQGAQYDALRAHAAKALGRPASATAEAQPTKTTAGGPVAVWQESARNWLMEIAIAGFQQLEHQTLAPFTQTLEHLQGEPKTTRLASILTGFQQELLNALPVSSLPEIPIYRWCDLWTRSMLAAVRAPAALAGTKVSGTLSILGVDVRRHGFFASCDAYGVLETGDGARFVRVPRSTYKVDVLTGAEVWKCFFAKPEPLLQAISEHVALKVDGMTLLPTGDLLWDGKASAAKPYSAVEKAAAWFAAEAKSPAPAAVALADRHPIHLAEPISLTGYKVLSGDVAQLDCGDGAVLRLATERLPASSELASDHVAGSDALFGLLRFDGGAWSVQPLCVRVGGKKASEEYVGSGAQTVVSTRKKNDTLAILRERAGKLLRQKA